LPHALGKNMGETDGVDFSPEPVLIEVVAPDASAASQILRSYIDDVASRYYGRQATDEEIDASLREDPSVDLALPSGVFLVARQRDVVLGCAGLRLLPEGLGEVKRLFVAPAARGRGLGARLMGELERIARGHGLSVLRLDTRHDLVEARRLYAALGYEEVPTFNHGHLYDIRLGSPWRADRRTARQPCRKRWSTGANSVRCRRPKYPGGGTAAMHLLSVATASCSEPAGLASATRTSAERGRGPRRHLTSPLPRSRPHR
jgi:ribosomal protein S18 acetylase RimI-like enzyme